jgi:hypothetical protein
LQEKYTNVEGEQFSTLLMELGHHLVAVLHLSIQEHMASQKIRPTNCFSCQEPTGLDLELQVTAIHIKSSQIANSYFYGSINVHIKYPQLVMPTVEIDHRTPKPEAHNDERREHHQQIPEGQCICHSCSSFNTTIRHRAIRILLPSVESSSLGYTLEAVAGYSQLQHQKIIMYPGRVRMSPRPLAKT